MRAFSAFSTKLKTAVVCAKHSCAMCGSAVFYVGPYGHQSCAISLAQRGFLSWFLSSKAWVFFIFVPPRVPDLASGQTPKALEAPSDDSRISC